MIQRSHDACLLGAANDRVHQPALRCLSRYAPQYNGPANPASLGGFQRFLLKSDKILSWFRHADVIRQILLGVIACRKVASVCDLLEGDKSEHLKVVDLRRQTNRQVGIEVEATKVTRVAFLKLAEGI